MKLDSAIFAGLLAGAALIGCSAPDPGAITWAPRANGGAGANGATSSGGGGGSGGGGADAGGTTDAGASADSGGGGMHDAGASAADSGGGADAASEGGGAINAFSGDGTYKSQPVQTSARQEHQNRGVGTDPVGQVCQGCHNGGTAVQFGFAGTVYTTSAGTTGAADVEVRVVKSDGTEYASVHSDADGNFWIADQNGFGAIGGHAGARNANATQLMPSNVSDGRCNNCHDGTQNPHLHVP